MIPKNFDLSKFRKFLEDHRQPIMIVPRFLLEESKKQQSSLRVQGFFFEDTLLPLPEIKKNKKV